MASREINFDDVVDAYAQYGLDLYDQEPSSLVRCQLCRREGAEWCDDTASCYYLARRRLGIPENVCRELLAKDIAFYRRALGGFND